MAVLISQSISKALLTVGAKQPTAEKTPVKKWIFQVERSKDGLLESITATAQTE
jgi:hypothetical protein